MPSFITLSSGFIVPASESFLPIRDNTETITSILSINRVDFGLLDKEKLISENVYFAKEVNELYSLYNKDQDYDSYIKIIDFIYDTMESISLEPWFKLQITDSKISSIVKGILIDFLKEAISNNERNVAKMYIPFNLRFGANVIDKNNSHYLKEIDTIFKQPYYVPTTWRKFITKLDKKNMLLEFYKLVFVDFY